MSDTGNPYGGQQNPYGGQPVPPAGPYGYGAPAPAYDYSHWIKRVGAYVLDSIFISLTAIPAYALLFIGLGIGAEDIETNTDAEGVTRTTGDWNDAGTPLVIIGAVLFVLPIAFFVWNTCIRQGRTGYSLGKGIIGIKLIGEADAQPIGGGLSFVRQLCHILDSFCYLGYLWPLWDAKRQTFADKIMKTVVINQPK